LKVTPFLPGAYVKLPAHRAGLPGNEISFLIVPLDPAYKAGLAGHLPVNISPASPFSIRSNLYKIFTLFLCNLNILPLFLIKKGIPLCIQPKQGINFRRLK
jgi:hypothetical protein